jgi:hypothetical protein
MTDNDSETSIEFRILRAMKSTLTAVIKDTTTEPGLKHPLSDNTIEGIRHCLVLISTRERDLLEEAGEQPNMRPRFIDEPETSSVIPISKIGKRNDSDS